MSLSGLNVCLLGDSPSMEEEGERVASVRRDGASVGS